MRPWDIQSLLARFGQRVEAETGEGTKTGRAVVRPLLSRSGQEPELLPTPLGHQRRARFLLLTGPDLPLACGDRVRWRGHRCRVSRAEAIYVGERLTHYRAEARAENGGGAG